MQSQQRKPLDSYQLDNVNQIYYLLGERYGLDPKVVKSIVSHAFFEIKKNIRNLEHTGILLHGLGTFEAFKTTIDRNILALIKLYKEGKITKEKLDVDLKKLWAFRQIAIKNNRNRPYKQYDKKSES